MSTMWAIYQKDIRSYFSSIIAYCLIAIFLLISGYFFFSLVSFFSQMSLQAAQQQMFEGNLNLTDIILTPLFMNVCVVMLFMIPMMTMRSFAEEKKNGTTELLFTYPLTDAAIVAGKFLAVVTVFLAMLAPLLIYPAIVTLLGGVLEMKTYLVGLLGLFFLGMSFISLGLCVSSLTENQIVAVVVSFGALLLLWSIGWSANFVPKPYDVWVTNISIIEHFKSFAQGLLDTQDIVFYLLFSIFFLFFAMRSLESRTWRG